MIYTTAKHNIISFGLVFIDSAKRDYFNYWLSMTINSEWYLTVTKTQERSNKHNYFRPHGKLLLRWWNPISQNNKHIWPQKKQFYHHTSIRYQWNFCKYHVLLLEFQTHFLNRSKDNGLNIYKCRPYMW